MQLASSFASFLDNPRLSDTKGKSPRVGSSLQLPGEGSGWKSNLLHVFATIFIEYVHL